MDGMIGHCAVIVDEPPSRRGRGFFTVTCRRAAVLVFGLLILFANLPGPTAHANPRYADVVIDAVTGEIFHQSNADRKLYPASLTKMMTLYMTFQALRDGRLTLDQNLPVSARAAGQAPSKLGLPAGASIRVEHAILALVTKSANDIATVLAEGIAGTEVRFAERMTRQARQLGMRSTTFRNASGLPNPGQISTASDMAKLAQALLYDFPEYYHYFSTRNWTYRGTTYRNHNRLLGSYEGMDGLKTGYIRASGFNLVASAVRGDLRVIAVVFGGRTTDRRNRRVAQLLDMAFDSQRGRYLIAHGSVPLSPPLPRRRPGDAAPFTSVLMAAASVPDQMSDVAPPLPPTPVAALSATPAFPLPPSLPDPRLVQLTVATLVPDVDSLEMGGDIANDAFWGIQVGAFNDMPASQEALELAVRYAPDLLRATRRHVVAIDVAGNRLYRARMVGLDQQAASNACARLQATGMACLTIAPGEGVH